MRTWVGEGKRFVQVTASIGVAMYERGESGAAFMHRADDALYMAKRMGRDRMRIAFRSANRLADALSEG